MRPALPSLLALAFLGCSAPEPAPETVPVDATAASDATVSAPADAAIPNPDSTVSVTDAEASPEDAGQPLDAAGQTDAEPADAGLWRSVLYGPNWSPGDADDEGRFLHDFSYAGYRQGETLPPLDPALPRFAVPAMDGDATATIQAAFDDAVAAGGGVVELGEGDFRIAGRVAFNASNVHLRGAGAAHTRLQFTQVEGMAYSAYLTVGMPPSQGRDRPVSVDVGVGQTVLPLDDVDGLSVGDDVLVGIVITPAFVEAHQMTGVWGPFNDTWQPFFRRAIVALDSEASPPTITLDIPLRYPLMRRDEVSVRRETGLLSEVSIAGLSVSTAVPYAQAWAENQVHAIELLGVKDAWVEDIGTFAAPEGYANRRAPEAHLRSGGILIRSSKRVTIANSHLAYPQHRGGGGNGYLYEIRQSNEILTRDSTGVAGRHNFIQNWGFGTSGCVWLRVHSRDGFLLVSSDSGLGRGGLSEFHHSLAMANLIDHSRFDDGWGSINRGLNSSGAGHSATENVVWNATGVGNVLSYQFGHGYVIGTGPEIFTFSALPGLYGQGTEPEDWVEGAGMAATLRPVSLYEDQRRRRLGRTAP